MKVASYNPEAGTLKVYTCNVCGNTYRWGSDFRFVERPSKQLLGEEQFITCSRVCREKMQESFIRWLTKKLGWQLDKATENYIQLVKSR